ncbi:MAG: L-lysine exporter family protein LysE/ArgO [Paraburkholderia sp.]|nr:L-lysine exporter family protein LysE/ArgO [Paraburkholderia sp.]
MLSHGFFLSLSLCLDIGLVNVAMLSLTLSHGFKPGFLLGLGSCFGDLAYAALALAGMTALLRFDAVRWIVWVGAAAMLLYLTWKMAREAVYPTALPATATTTAERAPTAGARSSSEFLRGLMLAISSPSAIVWFAAVGGALIAKAGATNAQAASAFLGGFFLGGLCWTVFLCTLASQGRKRAGVGLLRACHTASALLFAYLSYSVIEGGLRDLVAHAVPAV